MTAPPRAALRALVLAAGLLLAASPAPAQRPPADREAEVFGRVTDATGAAIYGVVVAVVGPAGRVETHTVLTDEDGRYRVAGLEPGVYRVRVARVGYAGGDERAVSLEPAESRQLDVHMRADALVLEGVVARGDRPRDRERARFEQDPGVTARVVGGRELKVLPGLAEADVLRAVEVLPGVVSTSDFSSAFNVRGGSADQNLILLDGFVIFNPFHLGGLFSVFNSDAIARVELLAGGFGAEYGGRVSSVLNVESRPAAGEGLELEGGVSVLAARLLARSRLPDALVRALDGEGGSWFLSARRSYFDQLLRPVVDFPYHLTDLQGYATLATRGGGRIGLSGYAGQDVLDLSDFQPPGEDADSANILRLRWDWGNRVAGLRWEQPLGARWTADARLGYARFAERLGFIDFADTRFSSRIVQLSARLDLRGDLAPTAVLRTGLALERTRFANLAESGGTTFYESGGSGVLAAGYAAVRWQPSDRWLLEPGLRLDGWVADGSTRAVASPRAAVKRFLGPQRDAAVKLAVGRYVQFLHSLRNEDFPVSNDNWVLAGRDVPPVVSDQVQVGLEKYWGDRWYASLEAYLRSFDGVTEFNLADDPNDPSDDLLTGDGRAHGLDLMVRRSTGRLTGWATLSLLRAERTLPDPLAAGWADLPPTVSYPPIFDRHVDVDLVAQYTLPRGVELGARWNYGSPLPYTRPVAQYFAWRHSPGVGQFEPAEPRGEEGAPLYVVLGERNAERYPPYHRLDLTLRRTFTRDWGAWTPYLQVLNAYNRKNVLFYFYDYDRLPPTRSGISMFPVLPAVGVEMSF